MQLLSASYNNLSQPQSILANLNESQINLAKHGATK